MSADCSEQKWGKEMIHGTYYPHIDGIRTFAVLSVFLYHLFAPLCPGGFVGVDMFFVISGYLIVGGIIRQLKSDTFSLSSFYYRRVKRIMPAYFVLIAAVFLVGCFFYDAASLEYLGETVTSSALFSTNIFFVLHSSSYFGAAADQNPLLNLWSLSVEEQFYLFIPLCLFLVWRKGRKFVFPALMALLLASLAGSIWKVEHLKLDSAFFWLHYRAWELLAGGILSMLPAAVKTSYNRWFSFAGWLMVLYPFFFYSSRMFFPGVAAIPPVLGTALLIRYGSFGWSGVALKWPLTVGIGKISYSLYLWHWPVIVMWKYVRFHELGAWDYAGIVFVSFGLGFLSWKFIEVPVRLSRIFWSRKKAFGATAMGCAVLLLTGTTIVRTQGARDYWHVAANGIKAPEFWAGPAFVPSYGVTVPQGVTGFGNPIRTPDPVLGDVRNYPLMRLGSSQVPPSFVLVGDSHAMAASPGMDYACRERNMAGLYYRARVCAVTGIHEESVLRQLRRHYPQSERHMAIFLRWLAENPQISTVYLDQKWDSVFAAGLDAEMKEGIFRGFRNLCKAVKAMGRNVVIIGPIPEWTMSPVVVRQRNLILGQNREPHSGAMNTEGQLAAVNFLKRMEKEDLCRVVWVHGALMEGGRPVYEKDGVFWYRDSDHLSPPGAIHVISGAAARLFAPASASASGMTGERR